MKKNTVFLILVFLITNLVSSQESCYNLDFETGTLIGWEGGTGVCCPVDVLNFGIVRNRHTIMKGKGVDANTCDKISVVAPGGLYSARLGNDNIGKEVETLSYTLDVTEANALFIYKYAVVLQDPGHKPEEQPYFKVSVFNENRELIDPLCGSYNVIATSNLPGFEKCTTNSVVYKDWTTVGLNLSAYIGKNIIIEFETGDCALGGHYGYAYVEAYCSSLKINATYCANANGTILSAPIGFAYLWETGETTQTIKIDNPINGKKYACQLTSATGCKVDISTLITFQEPIINFDTTGNCDNSDTGFINTTSNTDNTTNSFHWDFGDGTTSTLKNPTKIYTVTGDYVVTLTSQNSKNGALETYSSTVSLYIFAGGLVSNGNFETGTTPWLLGVASPITSNLLVTENGNTYFSIPVNAAGNPYDVNLSQIGLTMTQGVTYRLTFDAWSDVNRAIVVGIGLSGAPFTNQSVNKNLTTSVQSFSVDLQANFTSTNSRVIFDLGAAVGKVNIDNVTLNVLP